MNFPLARQSGRAPRRVARGSLWRRLPGCVMLFDEHRGLRAETKIGGSGDLFRLRHKLLTSRLSGLCHLTGVPHKASGIGSAAVPGSGPGRHGLELRRRRSGAAGIPGLARRARQIRPVQTGKRESRPAQLGKRETPSPPRAPGAGDNHDGGQAEKCDCRLLPYSISRRGPRDSRLAARGLGPGAQGLLGHR